MQITDLDTLDTVAIIEQMADAGMVMNIDQMPAGRELDALVAEKVMGWKALESTELEDGIVFHNRSPHVPNYSTDIAAAWQVHQFICSLIFSKRRAYFRAIQEQANTDGLLTAWPDVLVALRDRMPLAICRAALKVVME